MAIPAVAANDIIQVLVEYRLNDQRLFNVFHYRYNATPTTTEYLAAMAQVNTEFNAANQWIDKWKDAASENAQVWEVSTQRIHPVRSPRVILSVVDPGTKVGAAAPQNVTLSITRQVDAVGRGYNGRVQLVGLPAAGMTDGQWSAGTLTDVQPLADYLKQQLEPGLDPPILFPITWNPIGEGYNNVIGSTVHEEIRTMHRRTLRLGI